jgi:hypothetical protein
MLQLSLFESTSTATNREAARTFDPSGEPRSFYLNFYYRAQLEGASRGSIEIAESSHIKGPSLDALILAPNDDIRGTQRYRPTLREDEDALTLAIQLASQYGRYGYRRITALLQRAGWQVGKGRVERSWV